MWSSSQAPLLINAVGLDIATLQGQGHQLNRLPLQDEQLPLQVGERLGALLRAVEERAEGGVVGHQFVG